MRVCERDELTHDASELVALELLRRGATLAVAESCTGGLLGAQLTERSGSSAYFRGGVISYADAVKVSILRVPSELIERHGAVSAEVAEAMACGARLGTAADYALAVTGVAGPGGGSHAKPVGLVYLACAGPSGTRVLRRRYAGDRASVRAQSCTGALELLLKVLTHDGAYAHA